MRKIYDMHIRRIEDSEGKWNDELFSAVLAYVYVERRNSPLG